MNIDKPKKSLEIFVTTFIAAKFLFIFALAYNSLIVVDEFYQGGLPYYIEYGFYDKYVIFKTVLSIYFYNLAHMLGDSTFEILLIAREQTALLGIITLAILYRIARNIGNDKLEALFIICVTLAFSTFMERIFRVRSEPLALFFAMLALWVVTAEKRTFWHLLLAGVFTGAAFLTTQKAVYFNVALGVALVVNGYMAVNLKAAVKAGAAYTCGWVLALLAYSVYFRGGEFYMVIWYMVSRPKALALHGGEHFEFIKIFITQTLSRNIMAYALGGAGWLLAGYHFKRMSEPQRIAWVFSAMIAFFIFNHNQPWPYIYIWAIPFIALWSIYPIRLLAQNRDARRIVIMFIALGFFSYSFTRNIHFFGHSNVAQRAPLERAESLLVGPSDKYGDGISMLATRYQARRSWWPRRPTKRIKAEVANGNPRTMDRVFAEQPKIWILNFRTELLKDVLDPYFTNSYVRIFPNILITGTPVEIRIEKEFKNYWEGEYRLYGPDGGKLGTSFFLDNNILSGVVKIKTGQHTVRLIKSSHIAYLLPADIEKVAFTIPPRRRPIAFFVRAYTY